MISASRMRARAGAQAWIRNPSREQPREIAYAAKRCCCGGKLCTVSVRERRRSDDRRDFATAVLEDGTRLLVDRRAARRLPSRFRLTMRGLGPFRRLDLDLSGEEWGVLLYD